MVSKEDYLAACSHVYKVRSFDERLSTLYAEEITKQADARMAMPHFGGGVVDHWMGKLGELVFEHWLWRNGLSYRARCRCPWGMVDHVDFEVDSPQGRLSCDVKSGRLSQGQSFENVPIDRFGLQVPVEQVGADMPVVYPYVLFDSLLRTGVFVGYAYRFEVQASEVVDTYHRCRRVAISGLHPVDDLLKVLKVDGATESLEKIMV